MWRKKRKSCQPPFSPLCSAVEELEWCNRIGPPPTAAWQRSPCLWRTSAAPLRWASTVHTFPVKGGRIMTATITVYATVCLSITNSRLRCERVLTDPFSITLLSMITALEHCSQIISQKWPQVFLRGPWRTMFRKKQETFTTSACSCAHHISHSHAPTWERM